MPYESLDKIFYKNPGQYEDIYQKRITSESTYRLPLLIRNYPAFFVSTPELFKTNDNLNTLSRDLTNLLADQSFKAEFKYVNSFDFSKNQFLKKCLIEELILTNDIEGIKSSREDMIQALQANENSKVRFQGLAKKYAMLMTKAELNFLSCSGIRKLYDEIVLDEIDDEKDVPDGEFFRKDTVSVIDGINNVHNGLHPERKIIEAMEAAFSIFNDIKIPVTVRIAIFHYLIGYIHPFYDGNGRLSRFISSYFLGKNFDPFVALKLSYVIKKEKKLYYNAYKQANNVNNRGELTFFIETFIGFIIKAYREVIEDFSNSFEQYFEFISKINPIEFQSSSEFQILDILTQVYCFGDNRISMEELNEISGISEVTTRKVITSLKEKGIVEIEKLGKKHLYLINKNKIDDISMK